MSADPSLKRESKLGLITRLGGLRRLLRSAVYIKHERGVGYLTQWREFRRFQRTLAMNRAEFIGYELWDVNRPLAERLTTISNHDKRLIEYRMNPRAANLQVRDKAWATARLIDAGLAVAPVLGLVTLTDDSSPSTNQFQLFRGRDAVRELLASAPASGIVIKPFDGSMGESVHVFAKATADGLVHLDGTPWSVDQFFEVLEAEQLWKVEQRLDTHPTLHRIAGPTLGTLRLTTFRMLDGTIHLTPSCWKIPIGNSGLDHFSHGEGQLCAPIEADSGRIGAARYWKRLEATTRHPLTGVEFVDTVMPHWEAACELARRSAACFPALRSTAYDIAITESGPVVIEVNPSWGERLIQAAWRTGLVQGDFLRFLEELGAEDVIRRNARGIPDRPSC